MINSLCLSQVVRQLLDTEVEDDPGRDDTVVVYMADVRAPAAAAKGSDGNGRAGRNAEFQSH